MKTGGEANAPMSTRAVNDALKKCEAALKSKGKFPSCGHKLTSRGAELLSVLHVCKQFINLSH